MPHSTPIYMEGRKLYLCTEDVLSESTRFFTKGKIYIHYVSVAKENLLVNALTESKIDVRYIRTSSEEWLLNNQKEKHYNLSEDFLNIYFTPITRDTAKYLKLVSIRFNCQDGLKHEAIYIAKSKDSLDGRYVLTNMRGENYYFNLFVCANYSFNANFRVLEIINSIN